MPDDGQPECARAYGLTQRQYAAIHLKVPESGTDWLDSMIRASLQNDFAKHATSQGLGISAERRYEIAELMMHHYKRMQERPLYTLGLRFAVQQRLLAEGIKTVEHLSRFSVSEIRRLKGIGPKALGEIRSALSEVGLSLYGDESK